MRRSIDSVALTVEAVSVYAAWAAHPATQGALAGFPRPKVSDERLEVVAGGDAWIVSDVLVGGRHVFSFAFRLPAAHWVPAAAGWLSPGGSA